MTTSSTPSPTANPTSTPRSASSGNPTKTNHQEPFGRRQNELGRLVRLTTIAAVGASAILLAVAPAAKAESPQVGGLTICLDKINHCKEPTLPVDALNPDLELCLEQNIELCEETPEIGGLIPIPTIPEPEEPEEEEPEDSTTTMPSTTTSTTTPPTTTPPTTAPPATTPPITAPPATDPPTTAPPVTAAPTAAPVIEDIDAPRPGNPNFAG